MAASHQHHESEWHTMDKDYSQFVELLEVGDVIEFEQGDYKHWAVYTGAEVVVHRANPAEKGFSAKPFRGMGGICKEKLRNIWSNAKARINNKLDDKNEPHPPNEVARGAAAASTNASTVGVCKALANNCERFATWARNGKKKKKSEQAEVGACGVAAAIAFGAVVGVGVMVSRQARDEK